VKRPTAASICCLGEIRWYSEDGQASGRSEYLRVGTNTAARLLGEDTNGNDGWTLAWHYPNEPLTAHLTVKAIGPGGTSPDSVLGLYHPDPTS
jgi:hypothetical protein